MSTILLKFKCRVIRYSTKYFKKNKIHILLFRVLRENLCNVLFLRFLRNGNDGYLRPESRNEEIGIEKLSMVKISSLKLLR